MKKQIVKTALLAGTCSALLFSCVKNEADVSVSPLPYPVLPAQAYTYDVGNSNIATIGRVLFYDRALSLNNSTSCGSCHLQDHAFADKSRFSRGLHNGFTTRNTPTIVGHPSATGFNRAQFWDGRAAGMDTAVFMPIANTSEMHIFNFEGLPQKLAARGYYKQLFINGYGDDQITLARIKEALALFCKNLQPAGEWVLSHKMNLLEMQGRDIFNNKAGCYNCHNGDQLNGYDASFASIGLDVEYSDPGRSNVTGKDNDKGRYKVPTLMNIAKTAPYMHDGRFNTLREVIDHYDHGIQDHPNLHFRLREVPSTFWDTAVWNPITGFDYHDFTQFDVKRINLSAQEKHALEAYLNALTDTEFLTDPRYSDPFR